MKLKSITTLILATLIASHSYSSNLVDRSLNGPRGVLGTPSHPAFKHPAISAREAISIAERRYGGRAVGAKQIQTANGTAYRVRILKKNGKIKNVIIDQR